MPTVSLKGLQEKYPGEAVLLLLQQTAEVTFTVSSQTGSPVLVVFWKDGEVVATATLDKQGGAGDWDAASLARAFKLSPDDEVWTMNDRI